MAPATRFQRSAGEQPARGALSKLTSSFLVSYTTDSQALSEEGAQFRLDRVRWGSSRSSSWPAGITASVFSGACFVLHRIAKQTGKNKGMNKATRMTNTHFLSI